MFPPPVAKNLPFGDQAAVWLVGVGLVAGLSIKVKVVSDLE